MLYVYFGIAGVLFAFVTFLQTPTGKGIVGEVVVKIMLGKPKKNFRPIHNLMFVDGNKSVQIDHLVVTDKAIFVIETKNYAGRIYGSENQDFWTQVLAYGKVKNQLYNPISQNKGHIYALNQVIKDVTPIHFESIIVFTGRADLRVETTTPVVYPTRIRKIILNKTKTLAANPIDTESVFQALNVIKSSNTVTYREHVESIHQRQKGIEDGICPVCGGKLSTRQGKSGPFTGCSNYPKCKFTKRIS
jgi:hypothetical protein